MQEDFFELFFVRDRIPIRIRIDGAQIYVSITWRILIIRCICMQALTEMGVTLAIDNFGCGSSSLHWIKRMHTNKVKIDKSFVQNMLCETDDLAVVNAVIAMSHNLRMTVVANGVETEEQLSVIQQSGCDQLQGYVKSKPRCSRMISNGWS